ncbi:MAG: FAD-dependent oxidoreductase [Candidatus Binatia bacterium]
MGEELRWIPDRWDLDADVIVVGFGFAGGVAAIVASDMGARVILVEKMDHPGGISIIAGGGVATAVDAQKAFQYLEHTNAGRTPDSVLWALAKGMTEMRSFVAELVQKTPFEIEEQRLGGTYPFPGGEGLDGFKIAPVEGYEGFSWAKGLRGGARLFKVLLSNVEARENIKVYLSTPARRLIRHPDHGIVGLHAEQAGKEITVRARQGVILACGGFENNEEMKRNYFEAMPVYPLFRGNTGDGIKMAQEMGAALWHMWHFHGGYGFKYSEFPLAFRHCFRGPRKPDSVMPWIVVDKHGRRFMNEYPPAVQDTGHRALEFYDADKQEFPRIPAYLIFDERGRRLGPVGQPTFHDKEFTYEWSDDNVKEIERGWIRKANTLGEIAAMIPVDEATLVNTVQDWNTICVNGAEDLFHRPPGTRMPIDNPPYYLTEVWPIVSNTQGGPMHDAEQRILNVHGEPIERLFAAGECGSSFGHLYLEAGNITECFVTGRIASRNVVSLDPWCG